MRTPQLTLALAALLLLAACDSSSPEGSDLLAARTFEATVTTSSAQRSLTGSALPQLDDDRSGVFGTFTLGDSSDVTLTTIELSADDSDEVIVFVGLTADAIVEGETYAIGFAQDEDEGPDDPIVALGGFNRFIAGHVAGADQRTTVSLGDDGSVTITEATADVLSGTFRFETRTTFGPDGFRQTDPMTIEGRFRTDRRSR
jgi:hypothetical protein